MHRFRTNYLLVCFVTTAAWCSHLFQPCLCDNSYDNKTALMDKLLGSQSGYNPDFRPVEDQSDVVIISVAFSLISLVEIDDVKQTFTMNGFLALNWTDERIGWDTDSDTPDYLNPKPNNIWRPRMVLMNTLGDRDVFKDNYYPLNVFSDGQVFWIPGGVFKASCGLNMAKFPFDEQTCSTLFCPMGHPDKALVHQAGRETFDFEFFVTNDAWKFESTETYITTARTMGDTFSCVELIFKVKRRPSYFVLNLILPVLMLSFLNNFVFLIPDESGEKIGYGITVLLSLSVFLTTVSAMIPRASNNIPAINVYLFVLLSISVLCVIASMATVFLHHADENEAEHLKAADNYASAVKKILRIKRATSTKVDPDESRNSTPEHRKASSADVDFNIKDMNHATLRNKYRVITKHINKICFLVSMVLWAIAQIAFFAFTLS